MLDNDKLPSTSGISKNAIKRRMQPIKRPNKGGVGTPGFGSKLPLPAYRAKGPDKNSKLGPSPIPGKVGSPSFKEAAKRRAGKNAPSANGGGSWGNSMRDKIQMLATIRGSRGSIK